MRVLRTFGCIAMGNALLCIFRSRLLVYYAGSGVNRVQVVLSGFSMRLFCFVQAKALCRYGCIYLLTALVLVCVYVIVMSSFLYGYLYTWNRYKFIKVNTIDEKKNKYTLQGMIMII